MYNQGDSSNLGEGFILINEGSKAPFANAIFTFGVAITEALPTPAILRKFLRFIDLVLHF
jgi:hypothetical protein